jgi:hypothetical protein
MVQCRIKTFLSDWIKEKNKFTSVSMIRLVYDGVAHDYTKWKFSGQNIFFYDSNNKVETILWTTETITIVDDNCIVINAGHNKLNIGLELFYGGAIL